MTVSYSPSPDGNAAAPQPGAAASLRGEEALHPLGNRLKTLQKVAQAVLMAADPQDIALAVLQDIRHMVPCDRASIVKFDSACQRARLLAVSTHDQAVVGNGKLHPATDFNLSVLKSGAVNYVEDFAARSDLKELEKSLLQQGIRCVINAPLVYQGQLIGTLNLGSNTPGGLGPEHMEIAKELAAMMALAFLRTRQDRALRESEQNYREIFDAANDAIFVHDSATGEILDINDRVCEMYGGTRQQCLAARPDQVSVNQHPYTGAEAFERIAKAAAGQPQVFEWHCRKFTGEEFWVEVSLRKAVIGGKDRVLAVVRDITERKAIQEALLAERDFAENIIETAEAIVFVADVSGRIIRFNRFAQQATGYSQEEVVGRTAFPFVRPDRQEITRQRLADMAAGTPMTGVESVLCRKDGRPLMIRWHGAPLRNANGQVVAVLAIGHDITERKAAEEALRAQRDFVQNLIQTAQALVVVLAPDGKIVQSNKLADELTGVSNEESRGWDAIENFVPAEHRAQAAAAISDVLEGREVSGREIPILSRNGQVLIISWSFGLLRDAEGTTTGILATGHDVTELRRKEEQLHQAQKMEAVGLLAGGIAHDFNNQLTIIKGYCDLMLRQNELPEQVVSDLQEIQSASIRSAKMISQLLAFSRKQVLRPRPVHLGRLIERMRQSLCQLAGDKIDLSVTYPSALGLVNVDPTQMQQAIANIVANARDAMPNDGTITFELSNSVAPVGMKDVQGELVLLAVRDSGMGIAPEDLPRIFEPFFTTKPAGKGTGLGLPMVYGLVKQSGGAITVDSRPGEGTTFSIYFPRHNDNGGDGE